MTSYGSDNYCNVGGWVLSDVAIYCFNGRGDFTDSQFTVAIFSTRVSSNAEIAAFALVDSIDKNNHLLYNSSGGEITHTKIATGKYQIDFSDLDLTNANVQVSAINGGTQYCNVDGWTRSRIYVNCYNNAGFPIDAGFSVLAISN